MAVVFTYGMTSLLTTESGMKIKLMAQEHMNGLMVDDMKVSGRKITCMARVSTHGKMVVATKAST